MGRLDAASTGLLLLTSDGRVPNAVLRASASKSKVYRVVSGPGRVTDAHLEALRTGVVITTVAQRDGRRAAPLVAPTQPCEVVRIGAGGGATSGRELRITLKEGRNRQIRRMLGALGYETVSLHREQFMSVTLDELTEGGWRVLREKEMRGVRTAVREAARARAAAAGGAAEADDEEE